MTMGAPEVTMDAPETADPPPADETAPARTSREPATNPPPGDGTIVVSSRGPAAPGAGPIAGSRPMRTWRVANAERTALPPGTELSGVPELVALFSSSRDKVQHAARVAQCDLERLEEQTRMSLLSSALVWLFSFFCS